MKKIFLSNLIVAMSVFMLGCPENKVEVSDNKIADTTTRTDAIDTHADEAKKKITSSEDGIKNENKQIQEKAIGIKVTTNEPNTKKAASDIIDNTSSIFDYLLMLVESKKQIDLIKVENDLVKKDAEKNKVAFAEEQKKNEALNLKIIKLEEDAKIEKEKAASNMRWLMMFVKGAMITIGAGMTAIGFYTAFLGGKPMGAGFALFGLFMIGLGIYLETYAIYALIIGTIGFIGQLIYLAVDSIKGWNTAKDLVKSNEAGKKVLDPVTKNKFTDQLYEAQDFETMKFVEKVKNT